MGLSRKIFVLIILLFVVSISVAGWEKNFGREGWDEATEAIATDDGGYIVCGHGDSYGHTGPGDIYLMKINYFGSIVWRNYYGTSGLELCRSITKTIDGGYAMVGYTTRTASGSEPYLYIVKTDSLGREAWTKYDAGFLYGESILELEDGKLLIIGLPNLSSLARYNIMMTDADGDSIWTLLTGDSWLRDVIDNEDGTFTAIGTLDDDVYVIRFTDEGEILWESTYGGSSNEKGYSIEHSRDGNYFAVGTTMSYGYGINGYMLKVTPDGDTLWSKTIGNFYYDFVSDISKSGDSGYIISGSSNSYTDNYDVWLIRTDDNLDTLWTRIHGGAQQNDRATSAISTDDGGFFITGWTESYSIGNRDFYMIKCDSLGYTINPFVDIKAGWNLISWPFTFQTHPVNFTFAEPPIYEFNSESKTYYESDMISPGEGIWMLSLSDTTYRLLGSFSNPDLSVLLYPGWNLVGTPAVNVSVRKLSEDNPEIILPIFEYNTESRGYVARTSADILECKKGYWILCTDTLEIHLPE